MMETFPDDLLSEKDLAARVAELLCEAHYGDLREQSPLSVTDRGNYWRVEGNRNREGAINGPAEFFISIEKRDGRVIDFGEYVRCPPHPLVAQALRDSSNDEEIGSAPAMRPGSEGSDLASGTGAMFLIGLARGGIVFDAKLAVSLAEVLCDAHYHDVHRQAPIRASDKGKYWRVEGSDEQEGRVAGIGRFFASIQKFDGRLIEFGE
jgi:hypothetical protein